MVLLYLFAVCRDFFVPLVDCYTEILGDEGKSIFFFPEKCPSKRPFHRNFKEIGRFNSLFKQDFYMKTETKLLYLFLIQKRKKNREQVSKRSMARPKQTDRAALLCQPFFL